VADRRGDVDADWLRLSERFEGAGHVVATQATWWQGKALAAGRNVHASLYGRIAAGAENPGTGRYSDEIAVVTGASKGSIAASVVAQLLDGGATVIATTSGSMTTGWRSTRRCTATRALRRDAVGGPGQHGVLRRHRRSGHGSAASSRKAWAQSIHIKDAMTPTLLFPFAAPRVAGDLSEAGSRSEMEMKVLLWAVQRLIGGLSSIGADRDIASRLHVVLPGSPNRGMFGGDGAYGESKAALDAVVTRWSAEIVLGAASAWRTR
jgi:fatty acid synthase